MSKHKQVSEDKLSYSILQNKLRNLKEYDSRYGTKILDSIGANIASVDDVLTKQLSGVSMTSCANNKYLANEVDTVTNMYSDLLTRIANNQSGCGGSLCPSGSSGSEPPESTDLKKFRRDFMTIMGKNAKRGRKRKASKSGLRRGLSDLNGGGADVLSMNAKRRRKASKSAGSKRSKKGSKRSSKLRGSHVIF